MIRRAFSSRLSHCRSSHVRPFILLGAALAGAVLLCSGCYEGNYRLTGETNVYQADEYIEVAPIVGYGQTYLPHALLVPGDATVPRMDRSREEIANEVEPEYYRSVPAGEAPAQKICIVLNRCFLKYLYEIGKPEVLAYVEVEDGVGSKPIKNVFFQDDYQPSGALLNFQDAVIYGPTEYSGNPITIRFYVYELDKEDNAIASAVVSTVAGTAKTFGGPYGLVADLIGDVVKTIIETNVDDREFFHQVTLYPAAPGDSMPPLNAMALRTGTYVIVKKEVRRIGADLESLIDFEVERNADLGLGGRPSVVSRSGRLFNHRRMFNFYRELNKAAGWTVKQKLQEYARARQSAEKSGEMPPSVSDTFASIDRIIADKNADAQVKVREAAIPTTLEGRIQALADMVIEASERDDRLRNWLEQPPEDAIRAIDAWNDADIYRRSGAYRRSVLATLPPLVLPEEVEDVENIRGLPHGDEDQEEDRLGALLEYAQGRLAIRETQLSFEVRRRDSAEYFDYRSKSYLTFSVIDTVEPADPQLLNELYTRDAELVEKTLNTRINVDQLAQRIVGLQQEATDAIVATITARKLKGADAEERAKIKEALKKVYDKNAEAIEEAFLKIEAEEEIKSLTDPGRASITEQVSRLVERLKHERPLDKAKRDELKGELEKYPALWQKVKPFFDAAELTEKILDAMPADKSGGAEAGAAPAGSESPDSDGN